MATTNGPFAVAAGTVLTLAPPQASGVYYSLAQITNSSAFIATIMIGSNQFFILPFTTDLFTLPENGGPITASFAALPGGSAALYGPSYCTTTWYLPSDQITDSFPFSLTAQAFLATLAGPTSTNTALESTFNQAGLDVGFGPTTALTLRWITLSTTILSATTTGGAIVLATVVVAGQNSILSMMLPVPVTFVPVAETIMLELGPGGMAMPAHAGGVFALGVNIYSGAASAMAGAVAVTVGY
jgi:hypothetical protein